MLSVWHSLHLSGFVKKSSIKKFWLAFEDWREKQNSKMSHTQVLDRKAGVKRETLSVGSFYSGHYPEMPLYRAALPWNGMACKLCIFCPFLYLPYPQYFNTVLIYFLGWWFACSSDYTASHKTFNRWKHRPLCYSSHPALYLYFFSISVKPRGVSGPFTLRGLLSTGKTTS